MSRTLIRSHTAEHDKYSEAEYDGSCTYGMYLCDGGQYEVECYGRCYKTETADVIGHLPVFGGNSILYKDVDNGYFVISLSANDRPPAFSRLTEAEGKLWAKGIERYWASKV